ncbi:MAG: DNA polymerase III subunit delta' [Magnetococcales bacterium]|nr:DNA polymerase III subunit delta' [Magnetococcales bacterium]
MTFFPTLEHIIGHTGVLAHLRQVVASNRPGHAHLFFGPPGVGKATVAAAFIQALFCRNKSGGGESGCGQCPVCRKVAQGNHGDWIPVGMGEGKTRIGVDQVRQLAGFFALTPLEAPWKVATVDDAALMNEAAANALLKTLEEPPPRSLLILVTRQPGKLLPTIRSRCLKTRFARLTPGEVRQILTNLTPLSAATLADAVAAGGGDVGRSLAFSQGELPALRQQFFQEMAALPTSSLGQLSLLAGQWSAPERFALVAVLLKAWLQERLHGTVTHANSLDDRQRAEAWLKVVLWVDGVLRQTVAINLNHRLVLEAVFIRLARLQGADY